MEHSADLNDDRSPPTGAELVALHAEIIARVDRVWELTQTGASDAELLAVYREAQASLRSMLRHAESTPSPTALRQLEDALVPSIEALESDARELFSDVAIDPQISARLLPVIRARGVILQILTRLASGLTRRDEIPFLLAEIRDIERGLRRFDDDELEDEVAPADESEAEESATQPSPEPQPDAPDVLALAEQEIAQLSLEVVSVRAGHQLLRASRVQVFEVAQVRRVFRLSRALEASRRQLRATILEYPPADKAEEAQIESLLDGLRGEQARIFNLLLDYVAKARTPEQLQDCTRLASLLAGELDELRMTLPEVVSESEIVDLGRVEADGQRFLAALITAKKASGSEALDRPIRRVRKMLRRLTNLRADRVLQLRLDRTFGRRMVRIWDSMILWMIVAILGLFVVEHYFGAAPIAEGDEGKTIEDLHWTIWADTVICAFFLLDFFTRLVLTPRRPQFFGRRFFTEFIPSIPFALLVSGHGGTVTLLRSLRLWRVARALRALRPLIRIVRLFLFVVRAFDRLVERNAWLFNRNIVFCAEPSQDDGVPALMKRARELQSWITRTTSRRFAELPPQSRSVAAQLRCQLISSELACSEDVAPVVPGEGRFESAAELDVDEVIKALHELDDSQVADLLGSDFAEQLTASLRVFRLPFLRRLPVVSFVLGRSGAPDPLATTARLGRVMGDGLEKTQRSINWFADLYGTITGAQFLDRVGMQMVKATARPAKRLITLLVVAFFVYAFVKLINISQLEHLLGQAKSFLSTPVLALGAICFIPLLIGLWFRRIAGQAVDYYDRVAEAQFLALTEIKKEEFTEKQLPRLAQRVVLPEASLGRPLDEEQRQLLIEATGAVARGERPDLGDQQELFDWASCDFMLLYYRDFVDGAWFHRNDTKVANTLLGNLTLENIRRNRLNYGKRERKRLDNLDIARGRGGLRGPYTWFNFITHSVSQKTARLILEYNQHCIPLREVEGADPVDRELFEQWLARRADQTRLREEGRRSVDKEKTKKVSAEDGTLVYRTTEFNALHFLSVDADRDAAVERRYGPRVLELLREDRRHLVRDIFGTFPMHELPKERRTFNPYAFYRRYFAHGRVFVFPFTAIWFALKCTRILVARLIAIIRDVIDPDSRPDTVSSGHADLDVARRKVFRMRRPVAFEALRLRAEFDIEFLGLAFPGLEVRPEVGELAADDLRYLDASESEWEELRDLKSKREHQLRLLVRLLRRRGIESQNLSAELLRLQPALADRRYEALRAFVTAFVCNQGNCCELLDAADALIALLARVEAGDSTLKRRRRIRVPRRRLDRMIERNWERIAGPGRASDFGVRERFATALSQQPSSVQSMLELLDEEAPENESIDDYAMRTLLATCEQTSAWTEQLIAVRSVQTLGLIDLLGYEEVIVQLGGFERGVADDEASTRRI